ncbi:hypothetical protein ACEWY4_028115 [Coilia grayii]|uniref:Ras and Rab interactor 2 n=1 Tax=Coilia grayii TaxID=363190 RepID=A0ABD1IMR5_9TELE
MFWDRAPDDEDDEDCCTPQEEDWEWEQAQEQEEEEEEEKQELAEEEGEAMRPQSMPSRLDRRGSYFKLVHSFASELGELEQEMGQLRPAQDRSPALADEHILLQGLDGLVGEMSGVYLGEGHQGGCDGPLGHRHMSVLDRLSATHPIWLLLSLGDQDATRILLQQPPGAFLVRRSCKLQRKVLSVRVDDACGQPISDYPVKENQYTFSLEGSGISFADLFRLVAFYCISRDVLPFTLKLPEAVTSAETQAELKELARLGAGFWDSAPYSKRRASSSSSPSSSPPRYFSQGRRLSPQRFRAPVVEEEGSPNTAPAHQEPPLPGTLPSSTSPPRQHHHHHLHQHQQQQQQQQHGHLARSPSGTAPLCFVNPLFLQTHRWLQQDVRAPSAASIPGGTRHSSDIHDIHHARPQATAEKPPRAPPPPRPPPPRGWPQRPRALSAPVPVPRTMLQTITHFNTSTTYTTANTDDSTAGHQQAQQQQIPQRPPPDYMGTNHSQSRSPKKSALPIPVPRLHPKKKKMQPDVDVLDVHRCHIALDDETIAKALAQAKLPHRRPPAPSSPPPEDVHVDNPSSTSASPSSSPPGKPPPPNHHHHSHQPHSPHCREQRLTCLSFSTSSSSASSAGSTDLSTRRSLQRSPVIKSRVPVDLSTEDEREDDDDEEEDDEDNDEDNDYGAGLEQDLQLRLQAPGYRRLPLAGSRSSAALLILPRALKGQFRKVSDMLGALSTPERRAVRRVVELARNKGSYFGCLLQDYVSFMQENGGGVDGGLHTSAVDLLQTLRHFLTQMKAYLVHSSELQPPIESFVPEEQIDQVLEKAMHKCVLKPLKPTVEAALNDFQVRSGALQQLKENLALAKARRPEELGVEGAVPPDAATVGKIRHKFHAMRKMYSPEKKVLLLLHVCKLIYSVMQGNSGRMFGADDFLPMLTYVLAQCDMPQLDTDIQYMMELLDPALLYGEGGYYLTSAYSAMALIRNLQEEQAARALSTEAQNTLHQWHRRRTTQRSIPAVEDFQNYLRVALQEADSGCTSKTLQVRPYATTEEVCQVCALKFRVADPENYALFLITDGTSQQLALDIHPQRIKAELHSRPQLQDYHFLYRRKLTTATTTTTTHNPDPSLTGHSRKQNQNHSFPTSTSASHGLSNGLKE